MSASITASPTTNTVALPTHITFPAALLSMPLPFLRYGGGRKAYRPPPGAVIAPLVSTEEDRAYVGQVAIFRANFAELRHREVPRIPLPRTRLDKASERR